MEQERQPNPRQRQQHGHERNLRHRQHVANGHGHLFRDGSEHGQCGDQHQCNVDGEFDDGRSFDGSGNGATGICYDTPLTIVFSQAPTLNNLGTIKIFNTANPGTPVDTLDLTLGSPQVRTIAGLSLSSYPVIITNNTAVIYPHLGVLTSNQTYYVTIDDGVFKDSAGAFFAGIATRTRGSSRPR